MISEASIRFHDLKQSDGRLDLVVTYAGNSEQLWFEHPIDGNIDTNNLATALSTLAGTQFDEIVFDFPVDPLVAKGIGDWTKTKVIAEETQPAGGVENPAKSESVVLNFSGGFDSLAAKCLLPDNTRLVSLDFGGRFSREEEFFSQFDTLTVKTNLVDTNLRSHSWSFMGIGPLLLRQEINSHYFVFGGILEATGFRRLDPKAIGFTFPPFRMAGFQSVSPVQGITEFGTARILMSHCPELVEKSLRSLASPGEEKFIRKTLITRVVAEMMGLTVETPKLPRHPKIHYEFGRNFAVDITALYFLSLGLGGYADMLVSGIPASVRSQAMTSDFRFMEKAHDKYYEGYPAGLRGALENGLQRSSMRWYDERDHGNLEALRDLLTPFYDFG